MRKITVKPPRMTDCLLVTVLLLVIIYQVAPQQLPVSLYKLSLITMAGVVGYWIDRRAFPYSRPGDYMCKKASVGGPYVPEKSVADSQQLVFAASMIRRAIIMGAAMLAASLGA